MAYFIKVQCETWLTKDDECSRRRSLFAMQSDIVSWLIDHASALALVGRYYPRANAQHDRFERNSTHCKLQSLLKQNSNSFVMMFLTFNHATHKSNIFETMCSWIFILKFGQAPAMASRHLQIPSSHSIELFKPENSNAKDDCRATFKPIKRSKISSHIRKVSDTNIHWFE